MNIKLVACDMDGTLLSPSCHISDSNLQAIKKMQSENVEFVLCTGRNYKNVREIMDYYQIKVACICLNGGVTHDKDGNLLRNTPLSTENIQKIGDLFFKYHIHMEILTDENFYTTVPHMDLTHHLIQFSPICISSLDEIPDHDSLYVISASSLPMSTVASLKNEFVKHMDLIAVSSLFHNIEVSSRLAQKGVALKAYALKKQIPLHCIMTIGDSENDISMFSEEFGFTVAMENAMPSIQEIAKYKTDSCSANGVSHAIHKYVFAE